MEVIITQEIKWFTNRQGSVMSSSATNTTVQPRQLYSFFPTEIDVLVKIVYVAITVVNFVANFIVCYRIITYRELKNRINYYIFNISLSDFIGGVGIYPYIFLYDITTSDLATKDEFTQTVVCAFTDGAIVFFLTSIVSLGSLCAISFDRYRAIYDPFADFIEKFNRRRQLIIASCLWLVAVMIMVPSLLSYRFSVERGGVCLREWSMVYTIVYRIEIGLMYLFPISFLFVTFSTIRLKSTNLSSTLGPVVASRRAIILKRAEKVLMKLLIVFLVCWIPFLVYWILAAITDFFSKTVDGQYTKLQWARATVLIASTQGSIDPFLYNICKITGLCTRSSKAPNSNRTSQVRKTSTRVHPVKHIQDNNSQSRNTEIQTG